MEIRRPPSFLFEALLSSFPSLVKAYSGAVLTWGRAEGPHRDNIDRSCCQTLINVTLEKKEVEGEEAARNVRREEKSQKRS